MSSFKIINKKPVENKECEYEIEISFSPETIKEFRQEAISIIGEGIKVDGFRPGNIPEKMITEKFGEVMITEEAGRLALEKYYSEIITESKIDAIGTPTVAITKVSPDADFELKITTAIHPTVKLADYKKLASAEMTKVNDVAVLDSEIEEAMKELQQQVAHTDFHNKPGASDNHDHGDLPLPEVNEEFIKKFGDFKTVDDFKAKIKESILTQKNRKEQEKKRILAMDAVIAKSEIKIPRVLIESELSRMESEMTHQIGQMGIKVEDYLKHINKTKDDLRKGWEDEAKKRAQTQVILNEIAVKENIKPAEADVNREVDEIMAAYKDSDKLRATIFVETMLTNEKVWQFLEGVK